MTEQTSPPSVSYAPAPRLWVLVAYDNPADDRRWRDHFLAALAPVIDAAGGVVVAEATYPGGTPLPELPCTHLQYPCRDVIWQQERLLNLAVDAVPDTVEFVAWVAGAMSFDDPTWMARCVEQLRSGTRTVQLHDRAAEASAPARCETCHGSNDFAWATHTTMLRDQRLYDRCLTGDNARLIAHALSGHVASGCVTARLGHGTPGHRDFEDWAKQLPTRGVCVLTGSTARLPRRVRRHRVDNEAQLTARQIRFDPARDLERGDADVWRFAAGRDDLAEWSRDYFFGHRIGDPSDGGGTAALRRLGQIDAAQGNWVEAAGRYEEALSGLDADIETHLDLAEAMDHLGCDEWLPVAELQCFVADAPGAPPRATIGRLTRMAGDLYSSGRFEQAKVLFDYVVRHRPRDSESRALLADCQLRLHEPRAALATLEAGVDTEPPDAETIRSRARIYLEIGLVDAAAALLRRLALTEPGDADTLRLLMHVLERLGATDELADLDSLLVGLEPDERFELALRAALIRHDDEAIRALYDAGADTIVAASDEVLLAAVAALIRERDFTRIDRLLSLTYRTVPDNIDLLLTVIEAAVSQEDWGRASDLIAYAELIWRDEDDARLRVQQLKIDCLRLDLDAAEERLSTWDELPDYATPPIAALYASRARWDDVLELFADRVDRGNNIAQVLFLEAVTKATRETGRYAQTLVLVDRALETWPIEMLADYRDRLVGEWALAHAVGRAATGPPTEDIRGPFIAARTALLSRTLGRQRPAPGRRTIFFCTDANYLLGTMVAVFSLLRNNPAVCDRAHIHVVTSDDACGAAEPVLAQIGAAFATTIAVVPASDVVTDTETLRTTWGSFTPGHALSNAAYYRIFAAIKLVEAGIDGRALYLDSDIWVGGGIDRLLDADLHGMPLGSRPELMLPEIRAAAHRLNVPEERYFNSGVLLFDLAHPQLPDALAHALDFAAHKPELLTFVDQCALNVAFLGKTANLAPECNYYLRQDDPAPDWEPTVVHYLARPKPWDPSYRTAHCRRWLQELEMLGQVVDPTALSAVMAGLFPGTVPSPDVTSGS